MDLDLRKAIVAKNAEASQEQIEGTILDAIESGEEKMLPGLGVFFELCWNQSDEQEKKAILENIAEGIPQQ